MTNIPTRIIPLSEGNYTVGPDKVFRPFNLGEDVLELRSKGSLLVEVQPFLIINDKDIILLDTGLGFKEDGEWILINNLYVHHIHPEDITKILISHLHKDHSGGLTPALFPNADIYIFQKEYEYALSKGAPSYEIDMVSRLEDADNIKWLIDDSGTIDGYIHYQKSGGHSQEHIVWTIHNDDSIIFYGGDEAPQMKQMKVRYKAKYDYDGEQAMNLRAEWALRGRDEGWVMLFYHDYALPYSTL